MVLDRVLRVPYTNKYGFKHWYIKGLDPRPAENTTTDNECLKSIDHGQHTLFVFIIRNPFDWVGSMFDKPYHMRDLDRSTLLNFSKARYNSYEINIPPNHGDNSNTPWYIDQTKNVYQIESSSNIVHLRNSKNQHFKALGEKVRYFHLIKLETFKADIESLIQKLDLESKTDLNQAFNDFKDPKTYELDTDCKEFIISQLNNSFDSEYYL